MSTIDTLLVSPTFAGSPPERVEPVTLARTKQALNITSDSDDDLVRSYIAAARGYFEAYSGRQTIEAIYQYLIVPKARRIDLPRPPLREVLSVASVDGDSGVETIADPSSYSVQPSGVPIGSPATILFDDHCPPGYIELFGTNTWPGSALRITYVCGFGRTSADVPELMQQAIRMLVGHYYRNREEVSAEANITQLPMSAEQMLKGFKYDALLVNR